jgi:hypothetical protein
MGESLDIATFINAYEDKISQFSVESNLLLIAVAGYVQVAQISIVSHSF